MSSWLRRLAVRVTRRRVIACVMAASAAFNVGLPLADGYAERGAERVHAHVEQPGSSRCPRVHDHEACQICNALRIGSLRSTPQFEIPRRVVLAPSVLRRLQSRLDAWRSPASSPRAPPLS